MDWKHIRILFAVALAGCWAGAGRAQAPAVPKPAPRPTVVRVLSAADHDIFSRAFAAADRSDWVDAMALGNQGRDTTARQLLQWRYALDPNSGASFDNVDAVLKMATGWPLRSVLYARAEADITPDMAPEEIIQWFGPRAPVSAIGRIRLGEALAATGEKTRGGELIRRGWSAGSFDPSTEAGILSKDAAYLTPESDRARLDWLLWQGEVTAAKRQIARVDRRTADLARARIALASGLRRARRELEKVSHSTDPTLLFDWARALRADGKDARAHAMLLKIDPSSLARDHAQRWWNEVAAEARDALQAHDPKMALRLVEHADLTDGVGYAEQQFLAGFISLRFLKDPSKALVYFRHLDTHVSRPISKARAEYWQGRAYEALGEKTSAYTHYRRAAVYSETFYGQLAIARTEAEPVLHLSDTLVEPIGKERITEDALMTQMRVLAELGEEDDLRYFAIRDAQAYPAPGHLKQFLQTLSDWGYPAIAVRLAKNSGYDGVPMLDFAYPVLHLPPYAGDGPGPSPAVVHALIRQETEFNSDAISSAGARGLMQVMLAAAKTSARVGGLPYRPDDLLNDPNYNIQLGMIEFERHYQSWDNSLVLAAAAYNAGPGNVRKWIAANGDPSDGSVDAIDWIEQIPFGETRNYVERVLENMEVYENRLAGRDMPLTILQDLYGPASPPDRPVLEAPFKPSARPTPN
jgi:soluble lytic murein transglycosylase